MAPPRIGPLPTETALRSLYRRGVRRLINVSGVDLDTLYPRYRAQRRDVMLSQFGFADVFSKPPALTEAALAADAAGVDVGDYLAVADAADRAQFLAAVDTLQRCIDADRAVYVFCHRGVGRSPAVVAAALARGLAGDLAGACRRARRLAPAAHFSRVSLAALRWSLQTDRAGAELARGEPAR